MSNNLTLKNKNYDTPQLIIMLLKIIMLLHYNWPSECDRGKDSGRLETGGRMDSAPRGKLPASLRIAHQRNARHRDHHGPVRQDAKTEEWWL